MRLVDAVERERAPYERAWRRARRTRRPAIYFHAGRWLVASVPHPDAAPHHSRAAWDWCFGR